MHQTGPLVVSPSLSVNYYKTEYKEAGRPVKPSRATEISMSIIETGFYKNKHVSTRRTNKFTKGRKRHTHLLNSFTRHCINGYVWGSLSASNLVLHIQFSFPRRVPPNPPQRLIRKSRLAYDKLMAWTVYVDLLEIRSKIKPFLDITGKRQRRYFALVSHPSSCLVLRWVLRSCSEVRAARGSVHGKSGNCS